MAFSSTSAEQDVKRLDDRLCDPQSLAVDSDCVNTMTVGVFITVDV